MKIVLFKIPMSVQVKLLIQAITIMLLLLLLSGCTINYNDAGSMVRNLSKSYPDIWRLITAAAYLLGFFFGFKAVYALKVYGEARTMMSNSASLKAPITYLIVSAALIFSPQVYSDLLLTTFGNPQTTPLSWWNGNSNGVSHQTVIALLGLVQVIGVIAFVRGWLYIARAGDHGQPGNFAKGLTHIIGGIMAINIVGVRDVLWNTFGFTT